VTTKKKGVVGMVLELGARKKRKQHKKKQEIE
jgi:hypothetical protein